MTTDLESRSQGQSTRQHQRRRLPHQLTDEEYNGVEQSSCQHDDRSTAIRGSFQQQQQQQQQQKRQLAPLYSELLPPRHNKLYRAPPTPDLIERLQREKAFVLDCVAVASISDEFFRANPKYGSALPPYNGQKDAHTRRYFQFVGVEQTLARNKQTAPGTSIDGAKQDWFNSAGHSFRYLSGRNLRQPNGYSNEQRMGHDHRLWEHPDPRMLRYDRYRPTMTAGGEMIGYNGRFGYRRTTPSLRQRPSTFGFVNGVDDLH